MKKPTLEQRMGNIERGLRLLDYNYNAHARDETARVHRIMDARQTPAVGKKGEAPVCCRVHANDIKNRYAVGVPPRGFEGTRVPIADIRTGMIFADFYGEDMRDRARDYCDWLNSK